MPQITALHTAGYKVLADSVDAAMARNDDIGMDMLRDLMPELREAIEGINTGLRDVDVLLFEGLRDEAMALHEPELLGIAVRLNLEDKATWPHAQGFFMREGIDMPPTLDFDTLASLESAFTEIEQLRGPLAKLRRLSLEHAPISKRLAVVRSLRDLDPTKPVWAEAVASHEKARLAELGGAVRQAIRDRSPDALAELHIELVDPDWCDSVPRQLVRATRGAEVWGQMRHVVPAAEAAAGGLQEGHARLLQEGLLESLEVLTILRQHRDQWFDAIGQISDCMTHLEKCPSIALLVKEEGLLSRTDVLHPLVQPALDSLARMDARDSAITEFQQACQHLEYLVDHLPTQLEESAWEADIRRGEAEVGQSCQMIPELVYPDLLHERVSKARDSMRTKQQLRTRRRMLMAVGGAATAAAVVFGTIWTVWRSIAFKGALSEMREYVHEADWGSHTAMPERVKEMVRIYGKEPDFASLLTKLSKGIDRENTRQEKFHKAVDDCTDAAEGLKNKMTDRTGEKRLSEWPDEFFEFKIAAKAARAIGGLHANRDPIPSARGLNASAQEMCDQEEIQIAKLETQEQDAEIRISHDATVEFREKMDEIDKRIPTPKASDVKEIKAKLVEEITDLLSKADARKSIAHEKLLSTKDKKVLANTDRQRDRAHILLDYLKK